MIHHASRGLCACALVAVFGAAGCTEPTEEPDMQAADMARVLDMTTPDSGRADMGSPEDLGRVEDMSSADGMSGGEDMTDMMDMAESDAGTACAEDQHVVAGSCRACEPGTTNEAGDDPSGADTMCDDPCTGVVGFTCAQFAESYIKASNLGQEDRFGTRVDMDGDTMVVSAPGEDSSAVGVGGDEGDDLLEQSGAVYVFTRAGGVWAQQAYLKASNTGAGDEFGCSVAISGDTIAVGARMEDGNGRGVDPPQNDAASSQNSGAVYVFTRAGGAWAQQAYIKASNTGADDDFGFALDLDQDTLAVGARLEDGGSTGVDGEQENDDAQASGAVYVFTRASDTWSQQAYLKGDEVTSLQLGTSVALEGDTLVVGAPQTPTATSAGGAAFVFTRAGGAWSQQARLTHPNPADNHNFGSSGLALRQDTLAVGVANDSSAATGSDGDSSDASSFASGAVVIYTRAGATWTQQAYIKASNAKSRDLFGSAVALGDDMLAVGAPRETTRGQGLVDLTQQTSLAADTGAVYLFSRTNGAWSQRAFIKSENRDANDREDFGADLSIAGDVLVIGAPSENGRRAGIDMGQSSSRDTSRSGAVHVRRASL